MDESSIKLSKLAISMNKVDEKIDQTNTGMEII